MEGILQSHTVTGGAVFLVMVLGISYIRNLIWRNQLHDKRILKQKQKKEVFDRWRKQLSSYGLTVEEVKAIVSKPFAELVEDLQHDRLSATKVLQAYQLTAEQVNKASNAIVEPLFEATEIAEECDRSDRKRGMLHGIPYSIKDNYGIKGYDSCIGVTRWTHCPMTEDAVLVKVLKKHGAIPFCKTTVPQSMFSYETTSPIFGQTFGPGSFRRSAGGSSGGEGALIGAGGSVVGLAGDVGGSIRVPAHFCGCVGLKPTSHRISTRGLRKIWNGQHLVKSSLGPMGRDVDSVVLTMKALLNGEMFQMDSSIPPLHFQTDIYESKKKLRIGYYDKLDYFPCAPCCQRAVHVGKAVLEGLGHEMVPVNMSDCVEKAVPLYFKATLGDGGRTFAKLLQGDQLDDGMKWPYRMMSLNKNLKWLLSSITKSWWPSASNVWRAGMGCNSVEDWWNLATEFESFQHEVADEWRDQKLDAMIAPVFPVPATPPGVIAKILGGAGFYTAVYNTLEFPAGTIPVTRVTEEDEAEAVKSYPSGDPWHAEARRAVIEGTVGLPVGVQVISLPWQDEVVLRLMKEIESELGAANTLMKEFSQSQTAGEGHRHMETP